MSETHDCPIEDCPYSGDSLAGMRSHISTRNEGAHDWDALKADVEALFGDDETDDEPDENQPETSENDGNEDTDMDEYAAQWDDDEPDADNDDGEESTSNGGRSGVPRSWLLAGTAVVAVVVVLILVLRWRSSGEPEDPTDEPAADPNEERYSNPVEA